MRSKKTFALTTIVAVMLAGLPALSSAKLPKEDVDAIKASSVAWSKAANAAEWDKLVALYTEDGVLLPPNMAAQSGRTAIREYFAGFPPVSDMALEIVELDGGGDLAYEWGTYSMMIHPEGAEPVKDAGKYIVIHRKQKDGSWLILRDIYNSDMEAE